MGGVVIIQVLFFGGVIALIIWAIVAGSKKAKERVEALRAWAGRNGWSFDQGRDTAVDERYSHFSLFNNGHTRRAKNTIRGTLTINQRPHPFLTGDYSYVTTSTDSKGRTTNTTHNHSILLITTPYRDLPGLTIRREHFFDKIGSLIGFDDIDFEDAAFSKRFMVKSKDRRFAYDICTPRTIEYLMEHDRAKGGAPAIQLEHGELLIYTSGQWAGPAQFEGAMRFAEGFIDRWPDHMLAELENDSGFRTGIET